MNYAANISQRLLEGHLICAYESKEDFQRLTQNKDIMEQVETTLKSLDRKIQTVESGNAYYAVRLTLDRHAQQDAQRFFTELLTRAREELLWMDLLAESTQQESFVQAGNLISYSDVFQAIDFNQSLQLKLRQLLQTHNESSIAVMVTKLFERLKKSQLIIEENTKTNQYRFTSRLELMQEALIFVAMHNMLHDDDETDNNTSAEVQESII